MTTAGIEPSQHTAARIAGALYLFQMATAVFGESFVRGSLMVRGDANRTAENIIAHERLFRLSIAGDLLTYVAVIVLSWALYVVLRPVDRHLALLGVFFRLVENAVLCLATISSLVVLRLLSGVDYLKVFDSGQLQALARLALGVQGLGMNVAFVLTGAGTTIFAYLLLKSGYIPRAFALWGLFAAPLLAAVTLANVVFPSIGASLGMLHMFPMGVYEVGLGLWLLVKGIQAPRVA
jgi:Domain of unknown function (DUF4386)